MAYIVVGFSNFIGQGRLNFLGEIAFKRIGRCIGVKHGGIGHELQLNPQINQKNFVHSVYRVGHCSQGVFLVVPVAVVIISPIAGVFG